MDIKMIEQEYNMLNLVYGGDRVKRVCKNRCFILDKTNGKEIVTNVVNLETGSKEEINNFSKK